MRNTCSLLKKIVGIVFLIAISDLQGMLRLNTTLNRRFSHAVSPRMNMVRCRSVGNQISAIRVKAQPFLKENIQKRQISSLKSFQHNSNYERTSKNSSESKKKVDRKALWALSAGMGTALFLHNEYAQMEGTDNCPPFNQNNIKDLKHLYQKEFIKHAIKHIVAQDDQTVDAIVFLMDQCPSAIDPLTEQVALHFEFIHPRIIKTIIKLNHKSIDQIVHCLLSTENKHLKEVIEALKVRDLYVSTHDYQLQYADYQWQYHVNYRYNPMEEDKIFRALGTILVDAAIHNPQAVLVEHYNLLFKEFSEYREQLRAIAIAHYGQDVNAAIDHYGWLGDLKSAPACVYAINGRKITESEMLDMVSRKIDEVSIASFNKLAREIKFPEWLNVAIFKRFQSTFDALPLSVRLDVGLNKKNDLDLTQWGLPNCMQDIVAEDAIFRPLTQQAQANNWQDIEPMTLHRLYVYYKKNGQDCEKLRSAAQKLFGDEAALLRTLPIEQLAHIYTIKTGLAIWTEDFQHIKVPLFLVSPISSELMVKAVIERMSQSEPGSVSAKHLAIFYHNKSTSETDKISLKETIIKAYGAPHIETLSLDSLLALHQYKQKGYGSATPFDGDNMFGDYRHRKDVRGLYRTFSDTHPLFMFEDVSIAMVSQKILSVVESNDLSIDALEEIDRTFSNPQEKLKLKELCKKRYEAQLKQRGMYTACTQREVPECVCECTPETQPTTKSECHFCENVEDVLRTVRNVESPTFNTMLADLHSKERMETQKGNHTFIHARSWDWDYISDIYKMAFNLNEQSDRRIGDDYVFLRFDNSKGPYSYNNKKVDPLFLNAPIFGRTGHISNCSVLIANQGHGDVERKYGTRFNAKKIFADFHLQSHFAKYKEEFEKLKKLHHDARIDFTGTIVMLSIADKDIEHVYCTDASGDQSTQDLNVNVKNIRQVLHAFKTGLKYSDGISASDSVEFALELNKEYALDPYKGPRMYRFSPADQKKYALYCQERDKLFGKIDADIQKEKAG